MDMAKRVGVFWIILICGLVCLSSVIGVFLRFYQSEPTFSISPGRPVIIIDAGHGGMDGGAVSASGIMEKDINLSIALKLEALLEVLGFDTVMVRDSDRSIHDENAVTVRQQKSSDLKNRLNLLEDTHSGILISIHQNIYSQASAYGTQVFYGPNRGESALLAEYLQKTITGYLQPDNHREIKQAGDSLYILYHAAKPAVMVECGFLSNPQDLILLQDETYQEKMAFSIAAGLMNTLAHQENNKG